jgi:predicted nucleic acid-binding protein
MANSLGTVIDATVVVAALLDAGPHGVWAENVLATGALHSSELACAEAANIIRRLERAKIITTGEANAAYDDLMQLDVEIFAVEPFADRLWQLRHHATSYEACYLALAEALGLPLATLDETLARSFAGVCDFLTPEP